MFSMEDVKRKISLEAQALFDELYPPADVRQIYNAIRTPRVSSFRINTLKGDRNEVIAKLRSLGIKFRDVPFLSNAFFLDSKEKDLEKSDPYQEGKIYLQGISGMIPPVLLAPRAGEKILDMCAAPGSKTTQMAALMRNSGEIVALEPDFIRLERLKFNCKTLGAESVTFFKNRGEKWSEMPDESFDRVLCDVPCSGEGRFNLYDKPSYGAWKKNETASFANLQKKILIRGLSLLKVGGYLCYSTCTMNKEENEGVLESILSPSFELVPLQLSTFPEMRTAKSPKLKHALRILPSERMEGFFIALIHKKASI